MKTISVYLDGITVGPRLRKLDRKKVSALAKSMEAIGLQQPISVWAAAGDNTILVAGAHRYAAAEKLKLDQIDCIFITLDDLRRQLWEIDENLIRADLTELERADHAAKRAAVVRKQTELAKSAKTKSSERADKGQADFDKDTAEATGRSERSVRVDKRRGEKITPKVKKAIADKPAADKGVELDALASLGPEEQEQAVARVESGDSKDFREARDFIKGNAPTERDKQFGAMKRAYLKGGGLARKLFIKWLEKTIRPGK